MNERETPETDAFYSTFADGLASPSQDEWLERLKRYERQRDGLLEALDRWPFIKEWLETIPFIKGYMSAESDFFEELEAAIAAVKEGKP